MSDLNAFLFQTNHSDASSGGGATTLTSSGGSYQGSVDWQITGLGKVAAKLNGSSVTNGKNLTLIDLRSADGQLQLTLVQNPYESRVSYGGCASVKGTYIYNLTVVAKS
jgi:hypothetical protein